MIKTYINVNNFEVVKIKGSLVLLNAPFLIELEITEYSLKANSFEPSATGLWFTVASGCLEPCTATSPVSYKSCQKQKQISFKIHLKLAFKTLAITVELPHVCCDPL